jgi:hypothetical protein
MFDRLPLVTSNANFFPHLVATSRLTTRPTYLLFFSKEYLSEKIACLSLRGAFFATKQSPRLTGDCEPKDRLRQNSS